MNEINVPTCLFDVTVCTGNCCDEGRLIYDRYLKEISDELDNENIQDEIKSNIII